MKYKHRQKVIVTKDFRIHKKGDVLTILVGEWEKLNPDSAYSLGLSYDFEGYSVHGIDTDYVEKHIAPYKNSLKELLGEQ